MERGRALGGILGLAAALLGAGSRPAAEANRELRFEITASRFKFEPARVEVEAGDRVLLTLRSADTTHGFAIRALKVKAEIPKGGAPVGVAFVATRVGRFPIECSEYCGLGHKGMRGELVVTEGSR